MHMRRLKLIMLTFILLFTGIARAGLPAPVAKELERAGIPQSSVGVWMQQLEHDEPALAINASEAMNPASVMKLVTAFAALDKLGVGHSWDTRVAYTGSIEDGVLAGNLYLVGEGDPMLNDERLWKLLRRIQGMGIQHVSGDIVLDGSTLQLPPHDPFAFDGRGLRPYNSGPHGLLLHFNTLQLHLHPGEPGEAVGVTTSPPVQGLNIDNRISSAGGRCGVWFRNLDANVETTPDGPRLILKGQLPASCGERPWGAAPLTPDAFGPAVIAGMWNELAGQLDGMVRTGTTPKNSDHLLTHTSPALGEVVREMNKWSSNVIAQQLTATLGMHELDSLNMMADGTRIATRQLAQAGLNTEGLIIENGSGLSRISRIRADTLGEMLLAAWRKPYMPEFMASMSLMGVDGTAHRRLRDTPARGHAHVKTGTIRDVRAIAGYVLNRKGHRHAVVMMINHPKAGAGTAAQDAFIEWVWAALD